MMRRPAIRAFWCAVAVAVSCSVSAALVAQETTAKDPADPAKKPAAAETADPYAVPDGTPEEITEFLEKLKRTRRNFKSRKEAVEHAIKVQWAISAAGDKILATKGIDNDTATEAAEMKFEALTLLANAGIEGALDAATKAAETLKADPRKEVAELAQETLDTLKILSAATLPEPERKALIKETLTAVSLTKYSAQSIGRAMQLGEVLEQLDDTQIAGDYYDQVAKLLAKSGNPRYIQIGEMLAGQVRRLKLPGNEIEVTGKTTEGKDFDWAAYKGKVVLVDFWATWCGPCRAELPNVKANYEKYHAKGFEVVAISLDEDREALAGFLKDEAIPWTNLVAIPEKDGEPAEQPTAKHYGVTSIPTAILVGKDGKVVSLNARGEALTELLDKLLGDK